MSYFDVYPEISHFAGQKAAVYIGAKSFSHLSLTSFRNALGATTGKVVSLAVPPYAVRFDSAIQDIKPPIPAIDVDTRFTVSGVKPTDPNSAREIYLVATQPLTLVFSMGVLDEYRQFADVLSTITLEIKDLGFAIDASAARLVVSPGNAVILPDLKRDSKFIDTLKKYKLDEATATRVEGMLLYSGLATAVTQTVATPQQIDLKQLFPALTFDGKLLVDVSANKKYLFLTGKEGISRSGAICDCAGPGNGIGPNAPGIVQPGQNDPQAGSVGTITIGGPTRVAPTSAILGRRGLGQGDSGLYLPNVMAESLVQGPFPAVRIDLQDNGFIGWKAAAFVDFDTFAFTPDISNGCFFVNLGFRVEVYGSIHVDLGKLGKIRVTTFSAEQAGPQQNRVNIGFYVVIGTEGLYLKPVLEDVSFGTFEVFLRVGTLIGTPFGAWGAVIGYIFDEILSKIISSEIPIRLELELRRYMAKVIFPLFNAHYAADIEGLRKPSPGTHLPSLAAWFDGGPGGFLFSTGIDRH